MIIAFAYPEHPGAWKWAAYYMNVCAEDPRFGPLNYDPPASRPSAVASRSASKLVQAEKFHATRVNVANYNRSAHYLIKTVSASP